MSWRRIKDFLLISLHLQVFRVNKLHVVFNDLPRVPSGLLSIWEILCFVDLVGFLYFFELTLVNLHVGLEKDWIWIRVWLLLSTATLESESTHVLGVAEYVVLLAILLPVFRHLSLVGHEVGATLAVAQQTMLVLGDMGLRDLGAKVRSVYSLRAYWRHTGFSWALDYLPQVLIASYVLPLGHIRRYHEPLSPLLAWRKVSNVVEWRHLPMRRCVRGHLLIPQVHCDWFLGAHIRLRLTQADVHFIFLLIGASLLA